MISQSTKPLVEHLKLMSDPYHPQRILERIFFFYFSFSFFSLYIILLIFRALFYNVKSMEYLGNINTINININTIN